MSNSIAYCPPPTVEDFILWYRPGEMFYDFILGPVGSGKTTGIFFKLVYLAQMQQPSPIDGIRRTKAVVVRNTQPQLRDTTIPSWMYWFKDGVAGTWRATDKSFLLRFADVECEVLFRALDTPDDVARVLSLETTFILIDEFVTIDKTVFEALGPRAGRYPPAVHGGATNWGLWGSSNPGNEDSWWHEFLIENPLPAHTRLFTQPPGDTPEAENVENLPGRERYYLAQKEGKSEEWVRQFIKCQWGYSLDGMPVFPMFRRSLHVANGPLTPNPRRELVIGLDPGVRYGALTLGQDDVFGRLLIYDEIITTNKGADRVITENLLPLLRTKYPKADVVVAPDPAAMLRGARDAKSVVDEYRKYFRIAAESNNTLPPRLAAVEYYLTRLTDAGAAMVIDPSCRRIIRALEGGYRYTVPASGLDRPVPDKNEHSHPADSVQYLARYFRRQDEAHTRQSQRGRAAPARNPYVLR